MTFASAFLIAWNDVEPAAQKEFEYWHRIEHMPERLAIKGFIRGRRYVNADAHAAEKYLTVYEVDGVSTFQAEEYSTRVMNRTPWNVRMAANITHFVRRICRTQSTHGMGIGTFAAVIRAAPGMTLSDLISLHPDIVALHHGIVDDGTTSMRTDRMQTALDPTGHFGDVLIIEALSKAHILNIIEDRRLYKISSDAPMPSTGLYDLVYTLEDRDID